MISEKHTKLIRGAVIASSFIIVALILWNTYAFFLKFKEEERAKMEILAKAFESFSTSDLNADFTLEDKIILSNVNIPMIITDNHGVITEWSNLDDVKASNASYLEQQLEHMKNQNKPIIVSHKESNTPQFIYYRDSDLLTKLKYYPVTLILILILFASVIYLFFKSSKIAEQNKLWTGMAKETAHQIGTPLSSLLGWVEILRLENTDENTVKEIENDVFRLDIIAKRFSKIGSIPELKNENIVDATKTALNYLQLRSSKNVIFNFSHEHENISAKINIQLYNWVIENLVKNGIDAMAGKGTLNIVVTEDEKQVKIAVSDTGKGIPHHLYHKIFSPGFTTKKRGWGLGLSLAKRIIEDYHNGKILIAKSEIKVGTTIAILLNK